MSDNEQSSFDKKETKFPTSKEKLEPAARMVENAFGFRSTPVPSFLQEQRFQDVMNELEMIFDVNRCTTQEVLLSLVELLMTMTTHSVSKSDVPALAARAIPIVEQLAAEKKSSPEIVVIVSSILTGLAMIGCKKE